MTSAEDTSGYSPGDTSPEPKQGHIPSGDIDLSDSVSESWHVVVRAESQADREHAEEVLAQLSLEPEEAWFTAYVASYRVGVADAESTRDQLAQTDLGWTLVAPGATSYLLRSVVASGPGGDRPVVVDVVSGGGQPRRVDPERTLDDADIRDGDRLRVGFERRAGGQFFYDVIVNFETHSLDLRQFTFLVTAIDELYGTLTSAMAVKLNEDPSGIRSPQLRSIVMQSPLTMVLGATGGAVSLAALRVLAAVLRDPGMLSGFLPKVKTGWYDGRTAEYEARLRLQTVRALAGNVNVQVSSANPPEAEARELRALSAEELGSSSE